MTKELYHYGILGQKWGKKNGPPYPLDKSDYSAEEKKNYNVSVHQVHKNMSQMSDAELQKAINRINMQNQISNMDKSITQRGSEAILKKAKAMTVTMATAAAVVTAAQKISKLINSL